MTVERAFSLASKYSYFTTTLSKYNRNIGRLKLGNSGSLLQENFKQEWINSNIFSRDVNVYLYTYNGVDYSNNDFISSFKSTYEMCDRKFPFGLAEFYTRNKSKEDLENIMSSTVFFTLHNAMQYFLHWQRCRKLWWKKISSFPGRFHLGEISVLDENTFTVDIFAEFPWGKQILEEIKISPLKNILQDSKNIMQISNTLSLEVALVGLFCDAFNENEENVILKLNRRLTPYKCSFAMKTVEDSTVMEELGQLGVHVNRLFKKANVHSILLPDFKDLPIENQRNDEWGIPYTVVLKESTLKSGIVGLRNRDTTLQEEVHISDLVDYMMKIFNHTNSQMN